MARTSIKTVAAAVALALTGAAQASLPTPIDLQLNCISNSSCSSFESGLDVSVSTLSNQISFSFSTTLSSGVITGIYFSDSNLLNFGSLSLVQSAGVSFRANGNPGALPGEKSINDFSTSFSLNALPSPVKNGIASGESLTASFAFNSGVSNNDVLSALSSGSLRVGMHVQSLPGGSSASFASIAAPVPEPETYAMLLAGLGLIGTLAARRKQA